MNPAWMDKEQNAKNPACPDEGQCAINPACPAGRKDAKPIAYPTGGHAAKRTNPHRAARDSDRLVDRLIAGERLDMPEMAALIAANREEIDPRILGAASRIRDERYGRRVFFRGLIEFSNYCRNGCYYCGIHSGNRNVRRYRLTSEEILECCAAGHALGFRSFVLQSGEDMYFTAERLADIVTAIKSRYPDSAITLSVGERDRETYAKWKAAGADRYLLRHETATEAHYRRLHPRSMSLTARLECLRALGEIGYQVGAGFMVGSPGQTPENLAADVMLLWDYRPQMVGIGPYLPQADTVFAGEKAGTAAETVLMVALARLTLPDAMIPATTAMATLDPMGRERAMAAGANVVMPNLSPVAVRRAYALYDNKVSMDEEAAENVKKLIERVRAAGYEADFGRGDHLDWRGV